MSCFFVYHTLASTQHSYGACLAEERVGWQSNKTREEDKDVLDQKLLSETWCVQSLFVVDLMVPIVSLWPQFPS
jgi:hypothetical protein